MNVMKLMKRELDVAKCKAKVNLAQMLISLGKWANCKAEKLLGGVQWDKELWEE